MGRAQIALSQREYKTAETILQEALKQAPGSAEAHYLLGLALKGLRRSDDARPEFEEALRIRPKYAEARAAYRRGEYAGAAERFEAVSALLADEDMEPGHEDLKELADGFAELGREQALAAERGPDTAAPPPVRKMRVFTMRGLGSAPASVS